MPRTRGDSDGDLIRSGEKVADEKLFRAAPEPLGRSYTWSDELDRQRSLSFNSFYSFNRFYAPRASRPAAAPFRPRSLRRS